jgi:DNA invertase Pin-like site-specific DNA recombinase
MLSKLKCAIYTRVSTDMQAEREFNSCEAQKEEIRAYYLICHELHRIHGTKPCVV